VCESERDERRGRLDREKSAFLPRELLLVQVNNIQLLTPVRILAEDLVVSPEQLMEPRALDVELQ